MLNNAYSHDGKGEYWISPVSALKKFIPVKIKQESLDLRIVLRFFAQSLIVDKLDVL